MSVKETNTAKRFLYSNYIGMTVILSACTGACPVRSVHKPLQQGEASATFTPMPCAPERPSPDENSKITETRNSHFFGTLYSLSAKVDYFAINRVGLRIPEAEMGTPCNGAGDLELCKSSFEKLVLNTMPRDTIQRKIFKTPYMVTTKGNDVKLWSPDEFISILGEINTPSEAWLMVRVYKDIGVYQCEPYVYQEQGGKATDAYRKVSDGFEIVEQHGVKSCHPIEMMETTHFVGKNGEVRVLSKRVTFSDKDRCIVD